MPPAWDTAVSPASLHPSRRGAELASPPEIGYSNSNYLAGCLMGLQPEEGDGFFPVCLLLAGV